MANTEVFQAGYIVAIKRTMPQEFIKQAEVFVQARKPTDPALANFEPQLNLKPHHHGELNSWEFQEGIPEAQREARFAELRREYATDPEALEKIDVYDGNSPYRAKIREYRDTYKSGDVQRRTELDAWFMENYPHVSSEELIF